MLVSAALLGACASGGIGGDDDGGAKKKGPPASDPTTAEVFASQCASCHGPSGEGTHLGPHILNPVAGFAHYVARTGRNEMGYSGAMPSFTAEAVSDEQLTAIIDWLRSAEKPTTGAELYERFCTHCHGADAKSGRVGKNVAKEAGEGANEIREHVRQGHGGTDYGDRKEYMPAWPVSELTNPEVDAIAAYLKTLSGGGGDDDDGDDDDD